MNKEEKITVTRHVDSDHITYHYSCRDAKLPVDYGRDLTGHTSADDDELYATEMLRVAYGRRHKFPTSTPLPVFDDESDTADERLQKLIARINMIRAWVASCDARDAAGCGEATAVLTPAALIETLAAERKLYYQTRAGELREIE